jgi:hypothetical protein
VRRERLKMQGTRRKAKGKKEEVEKGKVKVTRWKV